ncbi:MAG TPA: Hsp20/alpha crystallin family protein [Candidatus Manganitrophaceae bacterium]
MLPVKRDVERGINLWEPFRELRKMQDEMDRMFSSFWTKTDHDLAEGVAWMPSVDMYEDKDQIVVKAELPGVRKEDVSLALTEDILTIKGERKYEREEKRENYFRLEGSYGMFHRALQLPRPVKFDAVKAEFKDGVLKIILPKAEESKTREIKIEVK